MSEIRKRRNEAPVREDERTGQGMPPPPVPSWAMQGAGMQGSGIQGAGMQGAGMPQPPIPNWAGQAMGQRMPENTDPQAPAGEMAIQPAPRAKKIGQEQLAKAMETLMKYKSGKARLDERLINNEKWWEGRAWGTMQEQGNPLQARRPTMWLFNVIMGKHADMVEAYPEPVILPREEGDEEEARMLTSVLPVILEQNDFEDVYSDQAWQKNKSGIAVYSVYWDGQKLNGLGDISICAIDPVNLFWEPGIEDIQKSQNIFHVTLANREELKRQYPQLEGQSLSMPFDVKRYSTEDNWDETDYAAVIDWYYHTYENGRKILQYCKFCGQTVLYASEDDEKTARDGWYADGDYPFVVDSLFRKKGSIAGDGYIDIGKNAQESIDLLDQACVMNAMANAIPRNFIRDDANINEQEYMDFTKPIVHVSGAIGDGSIMPIDTKPLPGSAVTMLNNKIEELKQTTGNQDVNNGATGGVTAASAIAALQESAGRSSRDGVKGTWRAYRKILQMVIERIRQFYDVSRTFRILGQSGQAEYVQYNNAGLARQTDMIPGLGETMRKPVFDITVSAQKQNAYSKMAQNELALQLLGAGVFNPQMADQSNMLLDMMDFNGKDELQRKVQDMGLMQQKLIMWQQMAMRLAATYEPATAEQMARGIMGGAAGGAQTPTQIQPKLQEEDKESGVTRRAREQAANASQPS